MNPDTLASLLAATPYPGCVVTLADGAARLNIGEHVLLYRENGWHYGKCHFEGLLSEHSAPETVHPEIRRALKMALTLTVEGALSDANARDEDPVDYLTYLCADKMLAILDVAVIADARKDEIGRLSDALIVFGIDPTKPDVDACKEAHRYVNWRAHLSWERDQAQAKIRDLERDIAAKDAALTTAHAALKRICEVIGADPPRVPDDAVKAVAAQLGADSDAEARASKAEAEIAEMVKALNQHGAPRHYDDPNDPMKQGAPFTPVERLRVILSIHHWKANAAERRALEAEQAREALLDERWLARTVLDDAGAPCRADGFDLDLAARIRALKVTT